MSTPRAGLAARGLLAGIHAYQRWLSPLLGPRCRFYPSCSVYAATAIERFGAVRGTGLAVWRLLRCHPFHPGGFDDVPPRGGAGRRRVRIRSTDHSSPAR